MHSSASFSPTSRFHEIGSPIETSSRNANINTTAIPERNTFLISKARNNNAKEMQSIHGKFLSGNFYAGLFLNVNFTFFPGNILISNLDITITKLVKI